MKLWVDYTNWRGIRAWREISIIKGPYLGPYHEEGQQPITTWVMDVAMADRDAMRRTLRLDHIHGFSCGDKP